MNSWIYVLFAAIVEVFWVLGLKISYTALEWAGTVLAIIISFYCIIKACEKVRSGTVYAVYTGAAAAAIALIDFTWLVSEFLLGDGICIVLIIIGVVGIQLTTTEQPIEERVQ